MKRLIFIGLVAMFLLVGCASSLGGDKSVTLTNDEGEEISWRVEIVESPITGICYEVLISTYNGNFDAISVDGEHCN